jgi:hypothetical protein
MRRLRIAAMYLWGRANDPRCQCCLAGVAGILDRLENMKCIRYAAGYKYQLRAGHSILLPELADPKRAPIVTEWIELDPDGTMRFRPGYCWDGASGPTFDSKSSMRASLYHDGGYQLMRMGLLSLACRVILDIIFRRVCLEDGMWSLRAAAWYHLVRIFASPAADPANLSPDEWAP